MADRDEPRLLIVPGLGNSGPEHWQTLWQKADNRSRRVDFGCWDEAIPGQWQDRLAAAVAEAEAPLIIVAHSMGCITVAQWAVGQPDDVAKVVGALLVAPPDVDRDTALPVVQRFAPAPRVALPFPSILVASRDDPYAQFEASRALADAWGSRLVDAGRVGHINSGSNLGAWPEGQKLLAELRDEVSA